MRSGGLAAFFGFFALALAGCFGFGFDPQYTVPPPRAVKLKTSPPSTIREQRVVYAEFKLMYRDELVRTQYDMLKVTLLKLRNFDVTDTSASAYLAPEIAIAQGRPFAFLIQPGTYLVTSIKYKTALTGPTEEISTNVLFRVPQDRAIYSLGAIVILVTDSGAAHVDHQSGISLPAYSGHPRPLFPILGRPIRITRLKEWPTKDVRTPKVSRK